MKAVIQRVLGASVTVDQEIISSIEKGLCVFIGISKMDTPQDMDYMIQKILKLKLFDNDDGRRWTCNVVDKKYEILCVSQFTLCSSLKGNKLDFHNAMSSESSELFYNEFLNDLRSSYQPELIKDGKFGAMMKVHIENDGPVTILLDSQTVNKNKTEDVH